MKSKAIILIVLIIQIGFVVQAQVNPKPNWKDSYEANGLCWCTTNFDHNLDSKTILMNDVDFNIVDVCEELEFHPAFRDEQNGDPVFNDIQCGNGPPNDA